MYSLIKRKLILLITLLVMSFAANCQDELTKVIWVGKLEAGVQILPLNLYFRDLQKQDSLQAVLVSPLQSEREMKSSPFKITNDSIIFTIKQVGIKYSGIWNKSAKTITGVFEQGVLKKELNFAQTEKAFTVNRPQEPLPPYPYKEEEVIVENKKAKARLAGTLTYPNEGKKFPAVILITGSGAQNRDEEIYKHKPFKVIADYLTRNNIAVLRLDDRGTAKSTGDISTATTHDFVTDIEAAYQFLRKHPKIDKKKIGLIGHSEGGIIAFMVASENKDIALVISLAGMGTSGTEVLMQQNKRIFELSGIDTILINKRLSILKRVFEVSGKPETGNLLANVTKIVADETVGLSEEEITSIGFDKQGISAFTFQIAQPWMQSFLRLEPCTYLQKLKCPLLALNGDKDTQVLADENLKGIKQCNPAADTIYVKGVNHLFQHCKTGMLDEYATIEETFSPEVLALMLQFIQEKLKTGY